MSQWGRAIGRLALLAVTVACDSRDDATKDDLFVLPYESHMDRAFSNIAVTVTEKGCVYTPSGNGDVILLAFQPGSTLAHDPTRVVLPDGSEVVDGETYDFGGGGADESELALPQVRPVYGATVEACRRSGVTDFAPGAIVIDSVYPVGTLEA